MPSAAHDFGEAKMSEWQTGAALHYENVVFRW